jgi:DNA integrity scanning protein DisA with diadenylate cyclase activity
VLENDTESPESLAWAELQRRGSMNPRYLRGIEAEIAGELARCLDPVVHEQDIRPYGAIVARESPHVDRLGRVLHTDGLTVDVIRSLADGIHTVVLVVKGEPLQLLLLRERMDTDQDYASHAVWVDGLIICNDARGTVRIVTDNSVTLIEGRRWIAKDLVYEAAEDIVQVVPAARLDVVRRLLELAHHHISPRRIGATMLYMLTDGADASKHRNDGINIAGLGLSILEDTEEPMLLHQARYRDGALLIGSNGQLLAVNVILRPSRVSEQSVPATKGTRHTSAARHTYDRPDVLAFVVSTDGPVTVFSAGQRIADLKRSQQS